MSKHNGMNGLVSVFIFGSAALILFWETHYLIPWLSLKTGLEPIIFWFIVAGLGMFLPLLVVAWLLLRQEGLGTGRQTWHNRLRFRRLKRGDWLWSLGSVIVIGFSSFIMMKGIEALTGKVETQPPFMHFEPLTPERYWILLIWLPYWLLNILGEEICWRGVILPRQEKVFFQNTWIVHGFCWGLFHIAFGWHLLLTLLPILFIQSYVVQRRQNSWIGVIIHGLINGPSFIAISLGLI